VDIFSGVCFCVCLFVCLASEKQTCSACRLPDQHSPRYSPLAPPGATPLDSVGGFIRQNPGCFFFSTGQEIGWEEHLQNNPLGRVGRKTLTPSTWISIAALISGSGGGSGSAMLDCVDGRRRWRL